MGSCGPLSLSAADELVRALEGQFHNARRESEHARMLAVDLLIHAAALRTRLHALDQSSKTRPACIFTSNANEESRTSTGRAYNPDHHPAFELPNLCNE